MKSKRQELEELLQAHDWWHMMSDDHRVYYWGNEEKKKILKMVEDMGDIGIALYNRYAPEQMRRKIC